MNIFIEYKLYFDWFFFSVKVLFSLYIAYKIMRRIIERDYTFKTIRSIDNGVSVTEALALSAPKQKIPFYERIKIVADIYEKTSNKLLLVDEERAPVIYTVIFLKYVFPIVLSVYTLIVTPESIGRLILVLIFLELLPEMMIKKSIKNHQKKFEAHAYKLFKYINNQKTAGTTTHKIITKLHKVIDEDEKLKNRLISFAAEYVTHNKYDEAFQNHILKFYHNADALALDSALRLGLEIGDAFTDSEGYEKLMFNKYMNTVDYETEKKKMHSVFSAFMFSIPTIALIGYVLYVDISEGLTTIFSK